MPAVLKPSVLRMMSDGTLVDGRFVGGHSTHDKHKPELCTGGPCGPWRTVCCGGLAGKDRDIDECVRCGKQVNVGCSFDEDFS